jgi:PAS domain S-box-containing protein
MHLWVWIALGALTALVIVEQLRIFKANREFRKKDEIFQVVTENAANMIALVDVKGRRLYNSPAYKRVLGYSPLELSETSSFEQLLVSFGHWLMAQACRQLREWEVNGLMRITDARHGKRFGAAVCKCAAGQ